MTNRIVLCLAFFAAAVVPCALLLHSQGDSNAPKSEEYLLLGNPNRGAGEPIIFVNPKDPNNIIVTAMATLNRLPSGEAPVAGRGPERVQMRVKELSTPD